MSSARRISNVATSRPSVRAAACTSPISSTVAGLPTLAMIASRRRPGTTSRKSSSRLPARSVDWSDSPVTLPPGRARLATKPVPTGSAAAAKTIGMIDVACFAARTTGVPEVTMTSTLSRTNSAAISAQRSLRPRPSDTRSRRCGPRSSRAPAAAARRRRSTGSVAEAELAPRKPDGRQLRRLLRARRERPRGRRAAEQRDELAPPHSITSSARASSVGGTSRPSALAVLRLMSSSNLVGLLNRQVGRLLAL